MGGGGNRPSPKYWILLGAVVLLVLAVVLPPLVNVGRYQRRITATISRSIGQPVRISSARLQLLPRPGFALTDLVVEEKPGFGNEPILRSASVVASLRLLSLWRGELEISRIDFDEASFNLVRAPDGRWNFSSILVQAAHAAHAPTAQRYASKTPRFPYIEATHSRINFKEGDEKKPFSFLNSDLSVWLENSNEWGVHFRAQPARTDLDLHLADTGVLRVDGTLRRAALLGEMPVHLRAEWSNAPLGQLSRLIIGRDAGWRGDIDIQSEISGTSGLTQIATFLRVDGFHRAEFAPARALDFEVRCSASFRRAAAALEKVACAAPFGSGELHLSGSVADPQTQPRTAVDLDILHVPASYLVSVLQGVRNGFAPNLEVAGTVNGHFHYVSPADLPLPIAPSPSRNGGKHPKPMLPPQSLSGEMSAALLTLATDDGEKPFQLESVRLVASETGGEASAAAGTGAVAAPSPASSTGLATGLAAVGLAHNLTLELQPVRLPLGAAEPLVIDGLLTPAGFDLHFTGSGTLDRMRLLSHSLGFLTSAAARLSPLASSARDPAAGEVTLDLRTRGEWLVPLRDIEHPLPPSSTQGTIAVANVAISTPYLSQPLTIISAKALLGTDEISWTNAAIRYGPLEGRASLDYPAFCAANPPCPARFQLTAPALDLGQIQSTLLGVKRGESGELLRQILDRIESRPVPWPHLSGTVQVGALSGGKWTLHDAAGTVEIAGRTVTVHSLTGHLLHGAMQLTGTLDTSKEQPQYQINAKLTGASPQQFAALFDEQWGSGEVNLSAQWKMAGFTPEDLAGSATGTLHWNWSGGGLLGEDPQATVPALAQFDDWSGDAEIKDTELGIGHSILTHGKETIPISGTISFNRELDLVSDSASPGFSITGTLERPEMKPLAREAEAPTAPLRRVGAR